MISLICELVQIIVIWNVYKLQHEKREQMSMTLRGDFFPCTFQYTSIFGRVVDSSLTRHGCVTIPWAICLCYSNFTNYTLKFTAARHDFALIYLSYREHTRAD